MATVIGSQRKKVIVLDTATIGNLTITGAISGYATTSYVTTQISNLVDSSPAALDTLNELAAALGDDPNFATTTANSIGTKWTQNNTKISQWDTAYGWGNHASAGYTSNVGDITGVTAGTGLTGGGTSGTPTLNVIGGSGITANANDIAVDSTVIRTTGDQTKTGNFTISKTQPTLTLSDTNGSTGSYPMINFDTANNQGVSIIHNEFDGELPVGGYGLVVGGSSSNSQFPTTGTLSFVVLGEIYAGSTTATSTSKVFHDTYHPNADKWTTARNHVVTLTGAVTGTATQSVDGTTNETWTVATTVPNDSINSQHYAAGSIDNEHIADNAINSEHYADNSIDALHINVSGNGTTSQYLRSDGDGTMSWVTPPNTTYTTLPNGTNLNASYGVIAAAGNGLKFWNGSDAYKIAMGNSAEYHYGPVTDYSIKTIIDSNSSTRGFTWGVNGGTPIAALNVGTGDMQVAGTITAAKLHVGGDVTSFPDGGDPDISTDNMFATEKVVTPKLVFLNDAAGDDIYAVSDDGNTAYSVDGNSSGAWIKWYGDKTLSHVGQVFDYWKGKGAEITQNIKMTSTTGVIKFGNGNTYKLDAYNQSVYRAGTTTSEASRGGLRFVHGQGPDLTFWYDAYGTGQGALKIYSNNSGAGDMFQFSHNGDFHADGNITAYSNTTTSDGRLKDNVRPLEGSLDKTLKLQGVKFDWIDADKPDDQIGFIAQQVEAVIPEIVSDIKSIDGVDTKVVNYQAVIPVLVEAMKEQQNLINRLEARLNALENKGE